MRKLDDIGVILVVTICLSGCRNVKEMVSNSKKVKSDVDLSVDYGRNIARQSLVEENNIFFTAIAIWNLIRYAIFAYKSKRKL